MSRHTSRALAAVLLLWIVATLSSPAWLPGPALLWYGAVLLGLVSFVNAAHIVSSWHIFYRNPVLRARFGRRQVLECVVAPLLYMPLFVFAAVKAYEAFPASRFVLFLLVFDGPVFAHHVASQDKGFLSLLSGGSARPRWVRAFYYPVMLIAFTLVFSRALVLDQAGGRWLAEALPFEGLVVAGCLLGAAGSAAAVALLWRRAGAAELVYFGAMGAWCLAYLAGQLRWGLPLLLLFIHSARHAGLYLLLAGRFFRGEGARGFWLPVALTALPFSAVLFFVYLGLPGFWSGLYETWTPAGLEAAYPWLMGIVGASLLHHYHIERYSWRFSDPELGRLLRSRLLGTVPA